MTLLHSVVPDNVGAGWIIVARNLIWPAREASIYITSLPFFQLRSQNSSEWFLKGRIFCWSSPPPSSAFLLLSICTTTPPCVWISYSRFVIAVILTSTVLIKMFIRRSISGAYWCVVNFSPESGWSANPLHPFVCLTAVWRVSLLIDGMMRLGTGWAVPWQEHRKTIGARRRRAWHNTRQHMEKEHLHKHTLAQHISHEHTTEQKYNLYIQPATKVSSTTHWRWGLSLIPYPRPGPIAAVLSKFYIVNVSSFIPHVNDVN